MKLTAQEEYGIRCLLQVARGAKTTPEIAEREGLTRAYVHKLMRLLRGAGLVKSVRGRSGGYRLARPAQEINVGAVLGSLDGSLFYTDFCREHAGTEKTCTRNDDCSIRSLWIAVDRAVQRALQSTQLSALLRTEPAMAVFVRTGSLPLRT